MPIGPADEKIPNGALDIVREFLKHTIDSPNEAKAKACLTKATLAAGSFEMPAELATAKYVIADPTIEAGQVYVPVTITDSATGSAMTMPLAPVFEDGAWKLDMEKMMAKLMGGSMGQIVEQMGAAMGAAMEGIGEALGAALGGIGEAMGNPTKPSMPPVAPADLEKIEKRIAEIQKELEQRHDLNILLDIDLPNLLRGEDEAANHRLLDTLDSNVLRNFTYSVTEANTKVPLEGRVKAIRLEGLGDPRDRVIFSEGARIIYRLSLKQDDSGNQGYYDGQDLGRLLTGVAAGMEESAPPGETKKGPSYQPTSDSAKTVKDYREFVEPVLTRRISKLLGQTVTLQIEWDHFESDTDDAKGLWLWGLNRICGALALLISSDNRQVIAEACSTIRLMTVPSAGMKSVEFNQNELWMYISPDNAEAGCFYESDIAEIISRKLKLRTRPMIAELERYAKTWEKSLFDLFGTEIKYAFDWDGFTCMPEDRNAFALTQLREVGIDFIYYAISNLAEKNPNFKQQFPQRIKWIYLEHTPTAEKKSVRGDQTTIAVRLYLHEGYDGYLTIKDLEKALPAIVANMPDIIPEPPPASDQQDLQELAALAAKDQEMVDTRVQAEAALARFSKSLEATIGNAIPVEIHWATLEGDAKDVRDFLNLAMPPLAGALAMIKKEDPFMLSSVAAMIDKIVVEQADCEEGHQFTFESRVLTMAIFREEGFPVMTPAEAYHEIREILGVPATEKRAEEAMKREQNLNYTPTDPAPEKKSPPKKSPPKKKPEKKAEKKAEKKPPAKKKKKK